MSQVIISPNTEKALFQSVFLAGGITNCKDWQSEVIEELRDENISIINPRRSQFDVMDANASYEQIFWEFDRLENMDIFSMYFCESDSDQPICMYELGRNVLRMQNRFPSDWEKRIIISVEDGYKRRRDVVMQIGLCAPNLLVIIGASPKIHASRIKRAARLLT